MAFVQRIGRGLRDHPGKVDCIILDHAGNHGRLGMVTDIDQNWLDDGDKTKGTKHKQKERSTPLPKICGECQAVIPPKADVCPGCGMRVFRRTVEHVAGELVELNSRRSGKVEPTVRDKALFYAELKGYAEVKRYSDGWASHKYREKFGVWPNLPQIKSSSAISPSVATRNWILSRQIAFAKWRRAHG